MISRAAVAFIIIPLFLSPARTQGLDVAWEEEYPLTDYNYPCYVPRVCGWDDAVYAGWVVAYSGGNYYRIYIISSFDQGDTWGNIVQVSPWELTYPITDSTPYLTVWRSSVYVVSYLHEITYPNFTGTAFYASSDSGRTWPPEPVYAINQGFHPAVSVWRDTINVVSFGGSRVKHRISFDGGFNFQPHDTLAFLSNGGQSADMEAYQNYVLLTYPADIEPSDPLEVFFQRSTDGGVTFEPYVMLSTEDIYPSQWPSLDFTEEGHVYVSWFDYKYSPYALTGDILLRHSPDWGETWEEEMQVTFSHKATSNCISSFQSQIHLVWTDDRWGDEELYYCNSDDYGQNWSEEFRLTRALNPSRYPQIYQKEDTLHIVWCDERIQPPYDQIFYKRGKITELGIEDYPMEIPVSSDLELEVFPNPFNASASFTFSLNKETDIKLSIYNILGKEVMKLQEGRLSSGGHSFVWKGIDDGGVSAPSGIYLAVLSSDGGSICKKVVLSR